MALRLEDDQMCYVCGKHNSKGLQLSFEHPEKRFLRTTVKFSKEHQGYKGIVHGGMMAMVLDEMMVNLAWTEGLPVVTAELTVRLKKAAKVGEPIYFEGRLKEENWKGRALFGEAQAKNAHGEILATAKASMFRIQVDKSNKS